MQDYQTFKTKSGYCHVYSDKILLSNKSSVGDEEMTNNDNRLILSLLIYTGIATYFLYKVYINFVEGDYVSALLFAPVAMFLLAGIIMSRNNSSTSLILRKNIKLITFNKGIKGLTRPYFKVVFENNSGKIKKRPILLPGTFSVDKGDMENAISIMNDVISSENLKGETF